MGTITTADGTEIFYKDRGSGQPVVFSHGWPLSADDWDTQMLFFLQAQVAASRSEFYRALPSGPFYGFNRPGAEPSEAIIENWWRHRE